MSISYDKFLHFGACFLIALVLYPLIGWWGVGAAVAAGVGKELYDLHDYGLFSWWDIVADIAGTAVGAIIIAIIKLLIS